MVEIVTFDPGKHRREWEEFIVSSYRNPDYVLLSPSFLRWQFLDNPANETAAYTIWLVLNGKSVIGQLALVPFIGISPDGTRFRGAHPVNLMIQPEHRAAGLGVILIRRLLKETPCVLNPGSNEPGAVLGTGLGMSDLGFLRRYVAVIDREAASRLAADGRLPSAIGEAHPIGRDAAAGIVAARLPEQAPASFAFPVPAYGVERSRAFLRWRYESHPGFAYEFLLSSDHRSLLVFHEEREDASGLLVLRVVDFLAAPADQDALLESLVRISRTRKAALIDFFCSLDCYDAALKRAGFFDEAENEDGRIAALFQPLDFRKTKIRVLASHPAGRPTTAAEWYVTKADSDQDRPNDRRRFDVPEGGGGDHATSTDRGDT